MNIYITDGTEDCFYTAAFTACADTGCRICSGQAVQLCLGASPIQVSPDKEKGGRVREKLKRYDPNSLRDISLLLRRGWEGREQLALDYLRLIVRARAPVRDRLADGTVLAVRENCRKVTGEAHNFSGFLRFMEGAGGIFYAPFAPDNDILELILPHFLKRLPAQPFIIHDTARKKAALYNGRECLIAPADERVSVALSQREDLFRSLWQEYYEAVNIAGRPHEKQMKGYMPVRYWKYLPEKNVKK